MPFYYCKLYPDIENAYLETVEYHYNYSNSQFKSDVLRLLKERFLKLL
jgi:hypothetical protein